MPALRALFHLMRADFLERSRRYSFLIILGLTIFAAYVYVPPASANYLTLGLGNYRGAYNSAWVGGAVAVLCSALLSLPAFYLVKNAIERDEQTGVGQIIATTPLSKPLYTLGKTFSNFIFLAAMVGVIALQPGIAEEAWGRLLMVPLTFVLFRRVSPNRTAFSTALILMAYWFAYLHASGNVVSALVSTFITGSLFILPISIVCLYYDLETAIGVHFWMDFLKFAAALVLFNR